MPEPNEPTVIQTTLCVAIADKDGNRVSSYRCVTVPGDYREKKRKAQLSASPDTGAQSSASLIKE